MDFNTPIFLAFFAVCAVLTYCMPRVAKPYFLLLASYAFYLYQPQNARLVWVLITATTLTWIGGLLLGEKSLQRFPWLKRAILATVVGFSLLCLIRYKYYDFISQLVHQGGEAIGQDWNLPKLDLIAPLGLSYFLFQSMGYLFDVYLGRQKPVKNPVHYALFVSFFPCIFTGPIERSSHLLPQFHHPHPFDYHRMSGGAFRMLWGYFKKMVLADGLSTFVSTIYAKPEGVAGPYLLAASLLFSYQLYLDFSGCCDIAIGAGRILGFDLMENFRRPFSSLSYPELWRRWHISLSSWFRDYLYIPLGGNRCSPLRQWFNSVFTFVVSGLWHGASVGYLIWGFLNGMILWLSKTTQPLRSKLDEKNPLYRIRPLRHGIKCICVYLLFTACIVFFAADLYGGEALAVYSGLFQGWDIPFEKLMQGFSQYGLTLSTALVSAIGIFITDRVEATGSVALWIRKRHFLVRWVLYYLLALAILFFGSFGKSAFIYQNY